MLFGAHESIAGGLFMAVERGHKATCDVIQIFNKSANQWKAKKLDPKEVNRFFGIQKATGVTVVTSHTSYLINIASPKKDLAEKSFESLKDEMKRCKTLRIPNLVMHPGSHVGSGEEAGLKRVAKYTNRLFDELKGNNVTLLFEATAGQGTNLGYKFEHLAYLIDKIDNKKHIGVCLDSCHIFTAGYPLAPFDEYKKTMKAFDDIVGMDQLRIFHINDSKKDIGTKRDRHEQIGEGFIGLEGFRNIVNDKRFENVPLILETPKKEDLFEDIENLKKLRGLVEG